MYITEVVARILLGFYCRVLNLNSMSRKLTRSYHTIGTLENKTMGKVEAIGKEEDQIGEMD